MANVKFICEVVDEPIDFEELKIGELFVDGESIASCLYQKISSTRGTVLNTSKPGISEYFRDDNIVCRVKIPLVNPLVCG